MKGFALFQAEIITKYRKFLRTSGPVSTITSNMNPWLQGIQVYSNEGPRPLAWAINTNRENLKIFSILPIFTKLSTKQPCVIGIQVYLKEGSRTFPKGDN